MPKGSTNQEGEFTQQAERPGILEGVILNGSD